MLPFDPEIYLAFMRQFAKTAWPLQLVSLGLLAALALFWFLRPEQRRLQGRLLALIAALSWFCLGIVFEIRAYAEINFSAPVYGALCIVQGALLLWVGFFARRMPLSSQWGARERIGAVVVMASLFSASLTLYAGSGFELHWPMIGLFPISTLLFTLGCFLMTPAPPWRLAPIPVTFLGIEIYTAWVLNFYLSLTLLLLACAALIFNFASRALDEIDPQ